MSRIEVLACPFPHKHLGQSSQSPTLTLLLASPNFWRLQTNRKNKGPAVSQLLPGISLCSSRPSLHSPPLKAFDWCQMRDGQSAVCTSALSFCVQLQPYEPLTTLLPRSLSPGPPHHSGHPRGHHLRRAFLYSAPQPRGPPKVMFNTSPSCLAPVCTGPALDCQPEWARLTPQACDTASVSSTEGLQDNTSNIMSTH